MLPGNLIYKEESYAIIGACFNVYKDKGCGFLEPVYQECLEIELAFLKMPFIAQKQITLEYRGQTLKQKYQPDFICFDKIIVEIKAVSNLIQEHRAQLLNYLNATGFKLGLLVNFGHYPRLEYNRIANTEKNTRETDN
jgi:GxxExxY protein